MQLILTFINRSLKIVLVGASIAAFFIYVPLASAQCNEIITFAGPFSTSGDLMTNNGETGSAYAVLQDGKTSIVGNAQQTVAVPSCTNAIFFSGGIDFYFSGSNESVSWHITATVAGRLIYEVILPQTEVCKNTQTGICSESFGGLFTLDPPLSGSVDVIFHVEGQGTFNNIFSRSSLFLDPATKYVCKLPAAGTITANPSSGLPGTSVSVTGSGWKPLSTNNEYRLFFDGVQQAQQVPLACDAQPNMTFAVPCSAPGIHTITNQLVDSSTQQVILYKEIPFQVDSPSNLSLSNVSSLSTNSCSLESVEFQALPSNDLLSSNRMLVNGQLTALGQRIFPDKKSPSESAMDAARRRKVLVAARTPFMKGMKIYFKSFDVDDPSTNDSIVDSNGPSGDDNRGMPKNGTLGPYTDPNNSIPSMCPDANGDCWAETDSNGIARVELTVTMHPGDNFKVAARTSPQFSMDSNGEPLAANGVIVSGLLTVWRRLHLEVDSMGPVQGNKIVGTFTVLDINPFSELYQGKQTSFTYLKLNVPPLEPDRFTNGKLVIDNGSFKVKENTANEIKVFGSISQKVKAGINVSISLVDDDDFNENNQALVKGVKNLKGDEGEKLIDLQAGQSISSSPYFAVMQDSDDPATNNFAEAYIQPSYDWAASKGYSSYALTFQLNVPTIINGEETSEKFDIQVGLGRNSLAEESADFWIAYLQVAYQPDITKDADPDGEAPGGIEQGTGFAFTTDAIISDSISVPKGGEANLINLEVMKERKTIQTGFNSLRTVAPHEVGHQFGLSGESNDGNNWGIMSHNSGFSEKFVPVHLNLLRYRINSPGK